MKKMKELISEKDIKKRLEELAKQIEKDYEGKEILVLCVLKGASFFTIELTQKIKNKIELSNGNLRVTLKGEKRVKILDYESFSNEIIDVSPRHIAVIKNLECKAFPFYEV